jgi:glycosyltransferase involved in cell wall biosynthesis
LSESKVIALHEPVDFDALKPTKSIEQIKNRLNIPSGSKVVMFGGWLAPHKDPMLFLETCKRLLNNDPLIFALVCGDGPLRQKMEALVREYSIDERFRFVGTVPDLSNYLQCADVLLSTSLVEASGRLILEAMYLGVPVVSVRSYGGIPEIVKHNNTGLLVGTRSSLELANACQMILTDINLANRLTSNSKKYVQDNHGATAVAVNYVRESGLVIENLTRDSNAGGF